MAYGSIVISSGHGKHVQGAVGILNEVTEARKVVDRVAEELRKRNVTVKTYHDDVSKTQSENLNRITDYHNAQVRDLDVSVHFNAYQKTSKPMGTECLYVSQSALASNIASAIASNGFINRGAKKRTDLHFLNATAMPSVLLEVCFVDSSADCDIYGSKFAAICSSIADVLGGKQTGTTPTPPVEAAPPPVSSSVLFHAVGTCSHFGGPADSGVSASEGLAFIYDVMDAPHLFLPYQPAGTTGLARRLNIYVPYLACRWDYSVTPKPSLLENIALVRATKTGVELRAFPADWGPHEEKTGRVADLSPGLMNYLGIETDDEVEITYPVPEAGA